MQNFSWVLPPLLCGSFLQAAILLRHRVSWKRFVLLVVLIVAGTMLLELTPLTKQFAVTTVVLLYFAYFIISYALVYPHHILPAISRKTLAGLTVIFWYLCASSGFAILGKGTPAMLICAIVSLLVFMVVLLNRPVHKFWRLICYGWFLLMMIYFSVYHLTLPFLLALLNPAGSAYTLATASNLVLLGMTLFYLAINVLALLQLLPIRFFDRSASTAYALWEWRLRTAILGGKYRHHPVKNSGDVLLVAAIFLAALLLNHALSLVPDQVLADVLILSTGYFFDAPTAQNT